MVFEFRPTKLFCLCDWLERNQEDGEQIAAWLGVIDGLPEMHSRLRRVLILNNDALTVIHQQDGPRTLFYLDPPYLHSTRSTTGEYQHEVTDAQHEELLTTLQTIKGRFLLSGYRSKLYDTYARRNDRRLHAFRLPNHAAGGKAKKRMTECV